MKMTNFYLALTVTLVLSVCLVVSPSHAGRAIASGSADANSASGQVYLHLTEENMPHVTGFGMVEIDVQGGEFYAIDGELWASYENGLTHNTISGVVAGSPDQVKIVLATGQIGQDPSTNDTFETMYTPSDDSDDDKSDDSDDDKSDNTDDDKSDNTDDDKSDNTDDDKSDNTDDDKSDNTDDDKSDDSDDDNDNPFGTSMSPPNNDNDTQDSMLIIHNKDGGKKNGNPDDNNQDPFGTSMSPPNNDNDTQDSMLIIRKKDGGKKNGNPDDNNQDPFGTSMSPPNNDNDTQDSMLIIRKKDGNPDDKTPPSLRNKMPPGSVLAIKILIQAIRPQAQRKRMMTARTKPHPL